METGGQVLVFPAWESGGSKPARQGLRHGGFGRARGADFRKCQRVAELSRISATFRGEDLKDALLKSSSFLWLLAEAAARHCGKGGEMASFSRDPAPNLWLARCHLLADVCERADRSSQSAQPPPELAQAPPGVLAEVPGPEVAKDENCCFVSFEPQLGHTGVCRSLPRTSFSNFFLHFWHVYSNIGIADVYLQFLSLGVSSWSDRTGGRVDQVKLDAPGILGSTRNQRTMNAIKTANASMPVIIHHCATRLSDESDPPRLYF